jgi:hypothetical protein
VSGPNVIVVVVLEKVVKSEPTYPGPSSAICGVICGAAGGGAAVPDGVQPDRDTTADVVPSRTVALQSLDLNPDALNLNLPPLSALPVAVVSAEETVIVAFASAPLPSIVRVPDVLRLAFVTLTAADASDGATNTDPMTSSNTSVASLAPAESILPERFIWSSHALARWLHMSCPVRSTC